jgi:hypothetical protein
MATVRWIRDRVGVRRAMLLAVLLVLLAPMVSGTPASAAVIAKKCSPVVTDQHGEFQVCVQYDGTSLNGVLDYVVHFGGSFVLDVGLWQCRGIDVGCPVNPNVTGRRINPTGHVFVPTTLLRAAGGHYYQACGSGAGPLVCSPYLAVPV